MVAITALALAAAFLFALSAFLQQRAARMIIGADTASLRDASGVKRLLGRLVRNGSWLTGWLTNLGGVGTQAAALKGRVGGRGPADDGGTAAVRAVTGVGRAAPLAVAA